MDIPHDKIEYKPSYSHVQTVDKNVNSFKDYYNSNDFVIEDGFLDYIKAAENGIKVGFRKDLKKWFPYNDVGKPAIAYGHNLVGREKEDFKSGITEEKAIELLKSDINLAASRCEMEVDKRFGFGTWSQLDNNRKEMLVDFMFNLGTLRGFPKFTKAVIDNDLKTMRQEFQRFSNGKPLLDRNNRFYNRYLK